MQPSSQYRISFPADSNVDSKRSSPSLLARQLRLRLVATEDADVPKSLSNIVVSIHAIATFQALHDYLRPRVAGILPSGSRLSGMLAALSAYRFLMGIGIGATIPSFCAPRVLTPFSLCFRCRISSRLSRGSREHRRSRNQT